MQETGAAESVEDVKGAVREELAEAITRIARIEGGRAEERARLQQEIDEARGRLRQELQGTRDTSSVSSRRRVSSWSASWPGRVSSSGARAGRTGDVAQRAGRDPRAARAGGGGDARATGRDRARALSRAGTLGGRATATRQRLEELPTPGAARSCWPARPDRGSRRRSPPSAPASRLSWARSAAGCRPSSPTRASAWSRWKARSPTTARCWRCSSPLRASGSRSWPASAPRHRRPRGPARGDARPAAGDPALQRRGAAQAGRGADGSTGQAGGARAALNAERERGAGEARLQAELEELRGRVTELTRKRSRASA